MVYSPYWIRQWSKDKRYKTMLLYFESILAFHLNSIISDYIFVLPLEFQLSRGEGWDPINRFNPAIFLCISHVKWCDLFCVQWMKMRGACSYYWYWWNYWPSMFKLSFNKTRLWNRLNKNNSYYVRLWVIIFIYWIQTKSMLLSWICIILTCKISKDM